jgi:hypothetical protein
VLVAVLPRLHDEDDLVDARALEPPQVLPDLGRRSGGAPQTGGVARGDLGAQPLGLERGVDLGRVAPLGPPLDELGPHVGLARLVLAEDVVVAERVAEEVAALQAPPQRLLLGVGAHHLGHAGDVGVHRPAHRHALLRQGLLVVVDPVHRLLGVDEGEGQRAEALLGGEQDRVAP